MKPKLTKILATLSETCSPESVRALVDAGINGVRLNTAHQNLEQALALIRVVRSVSETIAILVDTKGPEVRTRGIEAPLPVKRGDRVVILGAGARAQGALSFETSYASFVDEVPVGSSVLVDDGLVELVVVDKDPSRLVTEVRNNGEIKKNKSVNTPGLHLKVPPLSDKDRDFIRFAAEHEVDFIAHSFVRTRDDVLVIRRLLDEYGSPTKIIAKIENGMGVENLEEILDVAAGVMVARGDLGVEVPLERLPGIQKRIIATCMRRAKTVITATQMLHSMIDNPRPTRAEVSDVANAVFDGTDVLMLSGETAYGKYPLEAVQTMARIAVEAEAQRPRPETCSEGTTNPIRNFLAHSAARAAGRLPVKAIIADTETGHIARLVSSFRMGVPVYANSPNRRTVRELSLCYAVTSALSGWQDSTDAMVKTSLQALLVSGKIEPEDIVVILGGTPGYSGSTNFLQINTAAMFLNDDVR